MIGIICGQTQPNTPHRCGHHFHSHASPVLQRPSPGTGGVVMAVLPPYPPASAAHATYAVWIEPECAVAASVSVFNDKPDMASRRLAQPRSASGRDRQACWASRI